ncbi:MAG: hypothetical protein ABSD20_02475 [Terriglobales bacterium]
MPFLHGSKKKDLEKQAQQAEQRNDSEAAETAYCQLADEEKKNQQAHDRCAEYKQKNIRLHKEDADRIAAAKAALEQGSFDDATRELKAVVTKQYHDQAASLLASIPQLQREAEQHANAVREEREKREAQARQDAAANAARNDDMFRRGVAAYAKNDFAGARSLFQSVTGAHASQARDFIQKIDDYSRFLGEGLTQQKSGKNKQAIAAYNQALAIKPDGPGDIGTKLAQLQRLGKSADATNLTKDDEALIAAIEDFYNSHFKSAAEKLAQYNGSGSRKALALFYQGAAELSTYYLMADNEADKSLYNSALEHFHAARQQAQGFKPPEAYISPRIMKAYNEAAP